MASLPMTLLSDLQCNRQSPIPQDIALVLADSRKDDAEGKSIEARSKTHAVQDGATRLVSNLKALHTQADAKKAASSADMSAITSALDISKVLRRPVHRQPPILWMSVK